MNVGLHSMLERAVTKDLKDAVTFCAVPDHNIEYTVFVYNR